MRNKIIIIFSIIFIAMLVVTTWASLHENVLIGGEKVLKEPWGVATLFDTYFAFLTFYFWVLYKERKNIFKIIWFVLIMLLGNFAMAAYVVMSVFKLKDDFTVEKLLIQKNPHV